LNADPKDAWAWMGLGYVAESQGNKGDAIESFSRALTVAPNLREAKEALSRNLASMPESPP
jgi:cytochrome c-type biogenesis protein CcmH/NrfG